MSEKSVRVASLVGLVVLVMAATGCSQLQSLFSPSSTSSTSSTTAATTTFAVTTATAAVDNAAASATCPAKVTFTGTITTNMQGVITFKWERSDGSATPTETLTFPSATSLTAVNAWQLSATTSGWQRLHVMTPTDLVSNAVNFVLTCK